MGGDQILWHYLNLEKRLFQMYVVRFSGFMVIPSMLRVSPSAKLSISPSMLPSSSKHT